MAPAAAALNHVLAQNAWAQARLARFAGRTFRLGLTPFALTFRVGEDGLLGSAADAQPDASLSATPDALARYFLVTPHDPKLIRIEGDAAFGAELGHVFAHLSWEAEEDLSRVFGDILAHRIVGFARGLWDWRGEAALRIAKAVAEYFTEERPLLARPDQVQGFMREVDALRDATARLEKRIERLAASR